MKPLLSETANDLLRFLKTHWIHFILIIPGLIAVTIPHEAAHSLAALLQGGRIIEFKWLPSSGEWGHVQYSFAADADYNQAVISLAPYIMWIAACLAAGLLALRRKPWSSTAAGFIFIWLFVVPVADIANAVIPYVMTNKDNDLYQAFGDISLQFVLTAAAAGIAFSAYGWLLNRRLYRENALGLPAYITLAAAAAAIACAAAV